MRDAPLPSLTRRQQQAMQVIQEMTEAYGVSPTYLEIATELDLASKSSVNRLVNGLAERGYIIRLPHRARTIAILRRIPMPDFAPFTFLPGPDLAGQGQVAHG